VATLAELEVYAKTHRNALAVPRVAGKLLHVLAVASNAKSVVELGTSTGYSGVWLASAMQTTGGRVLTIEPDADKIKLANESFAKAKVASHVGLVKGKALDILPTLNGPFDFAFVDALKDEYIAYFEQLWPKMRAGGLIIADNIGNLKEQLAPYVKRVQSRDDAMSVSLHIGNGMELTLKL
jgi:predicted O-methyltransferase YrrM